MSQAIPKFRLEKWARKKFRERYSTIELMASVTDLDNRVAISIVALLEVDPAIRYLGMHADEVQYIKLCHSHLTEMGIKREAAID